MTSTFGRAGGSADSSQVSYRPDIDGLRAVAVLSVIVFHLSRAALPGGFLGVDIFFVLSGFLITSIVSNEVASESFSLTTFYARRIRRISPALLLMLFVTTFVASIILLPADLIGFAKSLISSILFVANIYFWRDTDYFSPIAETKPLLHIWSLGVEEQFYIFFPLLLAFVSRKMKSTVLPIIATLTVLSIGLAVVANRMGAETPAFFLLPTRAWELGAGAIVAVLPRRAARLSIVYDVFSLIGLGLVVIGLIWPLDKTIPVLPAALPIVVGTVALIVTGSANTWVAKCLAARPIVFIGLISYSLYLWHWPIIVLLRYYMIEPTGPALTILAVITMFAAAIVSWRFVEPPFRSRQMPIHRVLAIVVPASLTLLAAAGMFIVTRGLPGRLPPKATILNAAVGTNYRCPVFDYLLFGSSRACPLNLPSRAPGDADIVLLGNSHAQMYAPVWRDLFIERQMRGLLVPLNGCLPTVSINIDVGCARAAAANLAEIGKLGRVRTAIVGLTWDHGPAQLMTADGRVADNRDNAALRAGLDDLIVRLRQAGKRVVLIGPIPEPGWDVASESSRAFYFQRPFPHPISADAGAFRMKYIKIVEHFEQDPEVIFVRPEVIFCDAKRCNFILDGRALYADSNHIAEGELGRFKTIFASALDKLNK